MGYIRHNAFVVVGHHRAGSDQLEAAHTKAQNLFNTSLTTLVSEIIFSERNGYASFLIAPDGSKEGWEISDDFDEKRKQFASYLDSLAFDDGSNFIHFVDVALDEEFHASIDETNKREGEIFDV